MRIAETFISRQGEGRLTGVESFFVRTSGCNLRCWFCDTPYASWNPEGEVVSIETLVRMVAESRLRHVILTGGEPLLAKASVELCEALRVEGLHLTIETAGTIDRNVVCDLMSISPKLASSTPDSAAEPRWSQLHTDRRMPIETMRRLLDRAPQSQLKFVVNSADDYGELLEVVASLQAQPDDVWIMPQGVSVEAIDAAALWLRPWCDLQGFHYCDRMQIRWYGNRRGT